jgi:hypothetical protein
MSSDPESRDAPGLGRRLSAALARHPQLRRELIIGGASLFTGMILMPFLIYVAGMLTLGPYSDGGLGSLLADFYVGLFRGWPPAWGVALGPYAGVLFIRAARVVLRRWLPRAEHS